jgi:hypothetical protein
MSGPNRIPDDDEAILYDWELDESEHDRFDYGLAQLDKESVSLQFTLLAIVNALVVLVTGILITAILLSEKVRRVSFNLYILFTAIPDCTIAFFCLMTCALSAPKGEFYSEQMCSFQSWYLTFGISANCWMNGVISFQIHRLLTYSNVRRRYEPPRRMQVCGHAVLVYLYAACLGLFGIFDLPGHKTHLLYGFVCFPKEYDLASTLVYWYVCRSTSYVFRVI